jgi:DNA repair photolyase
VKEDRKIFHSVIVTKPDILKRFRVDAEKARSHYNRLGQTAPNILFCFTCDPYPPVEAVAHTTRQAIEIAHEFGFLIDILTKNPSRARLDFPWYMKGDHFAVTLTCDNDKSSVYWEPNADLPAERIAALAEAHEQGIGTWTSLEPVVEPEQTFSLIRKTHNFVGLYKVGKLNYHRRASEIDWERYASEVVHELDTCGANYIIKKDLAAFLPEGVPYSKQN